MKVHIHVASGKDREEGLALSLQSGLAQFDDHVAVSPIGEFVGPDREADIGAVFGLKGRSREVLAAYRAEGRHTIMFDKALIRVPRSPHKHLRVCIDGDSPLPYLMRQNRSGERWEALKLKPSPQRKSGPIDSIVLALSSQKYCTFHGLGDATDYAAGLARQCRSQSRRPIIYRPKPSWHDFKPIEGTRLSRPPEYLPSILETAHVLVTHGSSAAVDAIIQGVPAIALGECAASPVAGKSVEDVRDPPFPSDDQREQWLANLAWCQWSVRELQSGEAWAFLRREVMALS